MGDMGWGRLCLLVVRRRKLHLVLAASVLLCGGLNLRSAAQETPTTYAVQGVVINSLNRQPIARALVEAGTEGTLTDSAGHFQLNLPASAPLFIIARRPGYASGPASMSPLHVGSSTDLTLSLTPQSIIAGHISTSAGDDAEGTHVTLYRRRTRQNRSWWETQGQATTDSAGHFRLTNLQAPADYLLVTAPSTDREGGAHAGAGIYGYPAVFYPEGGETSANGLISLSPGQQTNVELGLSRQPFFPVTIRVRNDVGPAPLFIHVRDETGLSADIPATWNAQKRSALVSLPNGRYVAELRSYNQPELYGRLDFTVAGGPVNGLSTTVLPLRPVLVNVRKDFTASKQNAQASSGQTRPVGPGLNMTLVPAEGAGGSIATLTSVKGATDGSQFQIDGATPGRYWVRTAPYEGYVASVTSGGVDMAREALTIGPGNTTPPIEVTLRDDGAQIHCSVQLPAESGATSSGSISVYPCAYLADHRGGRRRNGWPRQRRYIR